MGHYIVEVQSAKTLDIAIVLFPKFQLLPFSIFFTKCMGFYKATNPITLLH